MPIPNFKPNAQIENVPGAEWGNSFRITLEDGTSLTLYRRENAVGIQYFTVTNATTELQDGTVKGAVGLFDYLHDLTQ